MKLRERRDGGDRRLGIRRIPERLRLQHLRRRHIVLLAVGMIVGAIGVEIISGIGVTPTIVLPQLTDTSGRLVINCGFDGPVSAPEICRNGQVIGVYIDDTTPMLNYWLGLAVAKYSAPGDIVLVGVSPAHPKWSYAPPALACHEFYPENAGRPIRVMELTFPRHRKCYIVQHLYGGLATQWGAPWRPPTQAQWKANLAQARHEHPRVILGF